MRANRALTEQARTFRAAWRQLGRQVGHGLLRGLPENVRYDALVSVAAVSAGRWLMSDSARRPKARRSRASEVYAQSCLRLGAAIEDALTGFQTAISKHVAPTSDVRQALVESLKTGFVSGAVPASYRRAALVLFDLERAEAQAFASKTSWLYSQ